VQTPLQNIVLQKLPRTFNPENCHRTFPRIFVKNAAPEVPPDIPLTLLREKYPLPGGNFHPTGS